MWSYSPGINYSTKSCNILITLQGFDNISNLIYFLLISNKIFLIKNLSKKKFKKIY